MSELYQITKTLHETVQLLAQKFSKTIEIESDFYWAYKNDKVWTMERAVVGKKNNCAIQAPQFRQILIAFEEELGENPDWTENEEYCDYEECSECGHENSNFYTESYSEALCEKFLDGLHPLIESEPVETLTELNKILSKLLK